MSKKRQDVDNRSATPLTRRLDRRSVRRVARRRKRLRWAAAVAVLALVLIGAGAVFWVSEARTGASSSASLVFESTTTTEGAGDGTGAQEAVAVLVAIHCGDEVPALTLVLPPAIVDGGLIIGLPGMTLLHSAEGFRTLTALCREDEATTVTEALAEAVPVEIGGAARVEWESLLSLLTETGAATSWPGQLGDSTEAAQQAADALSSVLARAEVSLFGLWRESGDETGGPAASESDQLLSDRGLKQLAALAGSSFSTAVLPGKLVQTLDSAYFEFDAVETAALLNKSSPQEGIVVQVQNGSGLLGAAETAGEMLGSLGYTLLPYENADGFPDVETTSIIVAPDAIDAAARVKGALGMGVVRQDDSLASKHIVVVVGKDFAPTSSPPSSEPET